jgi:DNA invertase Pin-like site-specific DNA recombinase
MATRKRALGYIRVSTSEQAEHGLGLEVQQEAIRAYCRTHGFRLVDVLQDSGVSGANGLDHRLGLAEAVARLEAGTADVLMVYRLDRLARDLGLQETVIGQLERAGREIRSVTEGQDLGSDDPTRVLVRQLLGAVAQYERALIRGRMMAGKAAKVRRGGYGGGQPSYGTRAQGGELVEDESERQLVERVRQLRDAGKSYRECCEVLTTEGYQPRRARHWSPMTVRSIAQRTE